MHSFTSIQGNLLQSLIFSSSSYTYCCRINNIQVVCCAHHFLISFAVFFMVSYIYSFHFCTITGYYPFSWTEEFTEYYEGPPADFVDQLVPKWEARIALPKSHRNVRTVIIRTGKHRNFKLCMHAGLLAIHLKCTPF